MNAKQRAVEIYLQHIALASTNPRLFRKTVMDQIMSETGCTESAASTHYNNAKKANPVEGLGRPVHGKGVRKMGGNKGKDADIVPDNECFTVIELLETEGECVVGRSQSFLKDSDATDKFNKRAEIWPRSTWVLIQGLGPNTGETFKLEPGEKEIKRHSPKMEMA
jgi:hypothetical protein